MSAKQQRWWNVPIFSVVHVLIASVIIQLLGWWLS